MNKQDKYFKWIIYAIFATIFLKLINILFFEWSS